MINPEIEEFIVQELGRMQRPENLIPIICERTGIGWNDAKQLITEVQERHEKTIVGRKRRMGVAIGVPTVGCGITLMMISIFKLTHMAIFFPRPSTFFCLIIGFLMAVGGFIGMFTTK